MALSVFSRKYAPGLFIGDRFPSYDRLKWNAGSGDPVLQGVTVV